MTTRFSLTCNMLCEGQLSDAPRMRVVPFNVFGGPGFGDFEASIQCWLTDRSPAVRTESSCCRKSKFSHASLAVHFDDKISMAVRVRPTDTAAVLQVLQQYMRAVEVPRLYLPPTMPVCSPHPSYTTLLLQLELAAPGTSESNPANNAFQREYCQLFRGQLCSKFKLLPLARRRHGPISRWIPLPEPGDPPDGDSTCRGTGATGPFAARRVFCGEWTRPTSSGCWLRCTATGGGEYLLISLLLV